MPSNDTYILLHKAKGNVGDLFIIERARGLLERVRPDRKFEVWDREVPFTDAHLEKVNAAAALVLTGGPGYQPRAYPNVYPLHEDLGRITAPIVGFGVGWKAQTGDWAEAAAYRWPEQTRRLLEKMEGSGAVSSCRDYLTVAALRANGFSNHTMTGCPTWYRGGEPAFVEPPAGKPRIAYTPGALNSDRREIAACDLAVLETVRRLGAGEVTVAFHHPVAQAEFEAHYSAKAWKRYESNLMPLLDHLRAAKIEYVDLSADREKMRATYAGFDLHVGFRVHAHLHFLSEGKPSVLIAEDGRGRGVIDALPALGFPIGELVSASPLGRFGAGRVREAAVAGVGAAIESEISEGYPRSRRAVAAIGQTWPKMKAFLEGLP